ncbi:hypothetical protein CEQ90_13175 [Lewinellaceae bacterium SD302]|nr:hypothetical protein CEQ90_13175 [Lewinellaceae bacterium SD302]
MSKDFLNGANGQPQRKATNGSQCTPGGNSSSPTVTVLDNFPLYSDPESPKEQRTALTKEEENLKLFKVFIKRNLPHQKPAPDLLVRIHQRIDAIKNDKMG